MTDRGKIVLEFISIIVFCGILAFSLNVLPSGDDSTLYYGLSKNLLSDVGFIDTIRNDFILPSIGHPLLLSAFQIIGFESGEIVSAVSLMLSMLVVYTLTHLLNFKLYFKVVAILLVFWFIPSTIVWGAELSLSLSITLLFLGIIILKRNNSLNSAIFLGIAIVFNLLVRPILAPLFYLMIPIIIGLYFWNKGQMKYLLTSFAIAAFIFFGVKLYSEVKYDDSRMVSGTYSEIPLYCSNNEYIPLNQAYHSKIWENVPENLFAEAVSPLTIKTNWKDRAEDLKNKVKDFVIKSPGKALKGFLWRLSKYTYNQSKAKGSVLFFLWLIVLFFFTKSMFDNKRKDIVFKIVIALLPIYVVLVTSVFPYVGTRYLLTPNLYYLLSLLIMISNLDLNNKYFNKVVL